MIKTNEDFVLDIARHFDLPAYMVRDVLLTPYRFLKARMAEGELDGLMLPYLGKIVVPTKKKAYLKKLIADGKYFKGEKKSKGKWKDLGEAKGDLGSCEEQGTGETRG